MHRILVVDDEKDILDVIALMLSKFGYDVMTAINGAEGIERFNESDIDIVVTDLFMPGINGDELARYVRNIRNNVPVIGITGTPWDIDLSCFDVVLKKPFSLKKLVEHVKRIERAREDMNEVAR